jgi:hypothetical protein
MTQDEVLEMADKAGIIFGYPAYQDRIEIFAKLVEAHTRGKMFKPDWDNYRQGLIDGATAEREACAKECEHTALRMGSEWMAQHCAEAIRARGEA